MVMVWLNAAPCSPLKKDKGLPADLATLYPDHQALPPVQAEL
jgi:hypothetical protein